MKNNIKNKIGMFFIISGVLLIIAAFSILVYNIIVDRNAGDNVGEIVKHLDDDLLTEPTEDEEDTNMPISLLEMQDTDKEMPVVTIDGQDYIGRIDIPELNVSLPVLSEWSYPNLKIAPCLYYGTVYKKNMVIAAHNYYSFFGYIKNLQQGSKVVFTDAEGKEYDYEVQEVTLLSPYDVDDMTSGEYALTLFTCNYSGKQRVTVRCNEIEAQD
jgi:sortase A